MQLQLPDEVIDNFYDKLEMVINTYKKQSTQFMVIGDFNARVGRRINGEETVMGTSHYEERNASGEKLISLAMASQLKIANTFFHKNKKKKWTWLSTKGTKHLCTCKQHELDYECRCHFKSRI